VVEEEGALRIENAGFESDPEVVVIDQVFVFESTPDVVVMDQVFVVSEDWEGIFVTPACAGVSEVEETAAASTVGVGVGVGAGVV
jgi:hypothetical protein